MVTDAVWLEKTHELVVVGDWMPVTILTLGKFGVNVRTIDNSSGWWNTVVASDLDGDGDYNQGIETPFFGMDELAQQLPGIKKIYPTYKSFAQSTFREMFDKNELTGAGRWQVKTFESIWLERVGDSSYVVKALPEEVQFSPVFGFCVDDFDGDGYQDILAAGNFYKNHLLIGKFDASYGNFLKGDGKGNWQVIPASRSGFAVRGQVRDICELQESDGNKIIIVSRNNDSMNIFRINKSNH